MSDGTRFARALAEATRMVAAQVGDLVPPEAQLHLLNAQRELLLAVAAIVEHNISHDDGNEEDAAEVPSARGRAGSRGGASGAPRAPRRRAARRPTRVTLD